MLALGIGAMLVKTYGPQPGYITDRMAGDGAATPAAGAAVSADPSIAVLPFVNRSSDAEQEYFSAGISEELLNLLAQIPELRVISRSSAFSFKGKDIAIPEIARQLNVAHILAATVVEQLKVTLLGEVPHAQETDPDSAPDHAFEWLASSVAEEDGAFDPQHPMLWPLENDPRWLPLLEFLGKSPAQLQRDAIAFEVTLPGQ